MKKTVFILLAAFILQCSVVSAAFAQDTLRVGETLASGQTLVSADGRFAFVMQADGNLVLYKDGRGLWSTSTNGDAITDCTFICFTVRPQKLTLLNFSTLDVRDNGDLHFFWRADTVGWMNQHYGSLGVPVPTGLIGDTLFVQNDGNVVLYDTRSGNFATWKPVWATNTFGH